MKSKKLLPCLHTKKKKRYFEILKNQIVNSPTLNRRIGTDFEKQFWCHYFLGLNAQTPSGLFADKKSYISRLFLIYILYFIRNFKILEAFPKLKAEVPNVSNKGNDFLLETQVFYP